MKVCHVSTAHLSSDIRIFQKECKALSKSFDVSLVVGRIDPGQPDSRIKIYPIKRREGRIKRILLSFFDTIKILEKADADVYHFHDPELIITGFYLKLKGKQVIYDAHEDTPRAIMSKYWIPKAVRGLISQLTEIAENTLTARFDMVVAATPYIANRFKSINKNTININNYPFKDELSAAHNSVPFNKRMKQVCYVGGIAAIRGIFQVEEASRFLSEGRIALAGPVKNDEIKDKINKSPNIEYKGVLKRDEVKRLLNSSIAGLVTFLPEPNHVHAQPNKMFEYMSAGIPVICSSFPLWQEMINKYDCGICVNPQDPKSIYKAINYLFENPEEAERMGRNGRMAVELVYNWETESKNLVNAYKKLLSKSTNGEVVINEHSNAGSV